MSGPLAPAVTPLPAAAMLRARTRWMPLVLVLCVLPPLLAGCEPELSDFTAVLERPGDPLGAAVVEIAGPGWSVSPAGSTQVYFLPLESSAGEEVGVRVMLVNPEPGPLVFTVAGGDRRRRPSVYVLEVADGENRILAPTHALRVRVSR